ncbi:Uncharacterised protein [Burkholderia pseudomallei]|nr:Uncharacterised protein [Burkholderia pseudomallei]
MLKQFDLISRHTLQEIIQSLRRNLIGYYLSHCFFEILMQTTRKNQFNDAHHKDFNRKLKYILALILNISQHFAMRSLSH